MGKFLEDSRAENTGSHSGFAVHPLIMRSPFIYTKYTWHRAVWLPDSQATSKEGALPVRSNYKLFLAWPAKRLCLLA